jgi:hypothetical protein
MGDCVSMILLAISVPKTVNRENSYKYLNYKVLWDLPKVPALPVSDQSDDPHHPERDENQHLL